MKICKKNLSLKKRIFIFFFGILLLMGCAYIFVISRFITRFAVERLDTDYNTILSETCDTVSNVLWDLTLTSQQLLDHESIQTDLESYCASSNPYLRKDIGSRLLDTIYILTMANTDIGLIYFYDIKNDDYIYSSFPINPDREKSSVLYESSGFQFQGPCRSQTRSIGSLVLALTRTETLPNGHPIILSVESGLYSLERPLNAAKEKSAYFIFTNEAGHVIQSTFPDGTDAGALLSDLHNGTNQSYRFFERGTPQGWSASIVIPQSVYTRNYYLALRDFLLCTLLIVVLVGFLALYFWKSVFHPLQLFDKQLSGLLSEHLPEDQMHSSIPEYDYLLKKIALLQKQIQDMICNAIEQEKHSSRMQLEKLRAQINPHFLMNTLNTLHWMALMNKQTDIDNITQALSHLLTYNLDKQSSETNLKNEIMALKEYIILQKVRYSFDFQICSLTELEHLNYPCPKFILQPLIENSLSHGYREQMQIVLDIRVGKQIEIEVRDTGTGICEDTLQKLQQLVPVSASSVSAQERETGEFVHFGIGLPYVVQSINDFYHGMYEFSITSVPDRGTSIHLTIPKLKGGGYRVEDTDH